MMLEEKIKQIKDNSSEKSLIIEKYKPLIASVVSRFTGKFVEYGKDEELSVGLLAFDEAINSFDESKGKFLSFSKLVIKKRLIDYYKKEKRRVPTLSIYEEVKNSSNEDNKNNLLYGESIKAYQDDIVKYYRRDDILALKDELSNWSISFDELAKASPKHKGTKKIYRDIIKFIIMSPEIYNKMFDKKYFPVKEIQKNLKIPRKKIERGRKYIISCVIITLGDYEYIKEFLKW